MEDFSNSHLYLQTVPGACINRNEMCHLHVLMELKHSIDSQGSAGAWWIMPRTPDPEVGGSSPIRVRPFCVLEQGTFTPQQYW